MPERKSTVIDHLSACEKAGEALKMSPKAVDETVNGYHDAALELINKAKEQFDDIEFQGARIGIRVSKGVGEGGIKIYDVDMAMPLSDLETINDHLEIKEKENESITDVEAPKEKKKKSA